MTRVLAITTSDAAYFPMVQGTIASIRDRPEAANVPIAFLDTGCNPEQRDWLQQHVHGILTPDWHFDFPGRDSAPGYLKGLLARPLLRQYFPGFDLYFWIDADAWIQDWTGVELFLRSALRRRGLAIVPEIDRGSLLQYGELPRIWQWARGVYEPLFGADVARELMSFPMLNAGVFCLHADAPHWDRWRDMLNRVCHQSLSIYSDQVVLNYLVYRDNLFKFTELLPCWCNWTCHFGLPWWDVDRGVFVEPYMPHMPIAVLHQTSQPKLDRAVVYATDLRAREVDLWYRRRS